MSESLVPKIAEALAIRSRHDRGLCSALEAECLLLEAGFYNVEFGSSGIRAVAYLGVRYVLERSPE